MRRDGGLRTLATFGLAVGGPATLVSGVAVLVTLTAGTPRALVAALLAAAALTGLSWVVFVVDDLARRARAGAGGDGPLSGDG